MQHLVNWFRWIEQLYLRFSPYSLTRFRGLPHEMAIVKYIQKFSWLISLYWYWCCRGPMQLSVFGQLNEIETKLYNVLRDGKCNPYRAGWYSKNKCCFSYTCSSMLSRSSWWTSMGSLIAPTVNQTTLSNEYTQRTRDHTTRLKRTFSYNFISLPSSFTWFLARDGSSGKNIF